MPPKRKTSNSDLKDQSLRKSPRTNRSTSASMTAANSVSKTTPASKKSSSPSKAASNHKKPNAATSASKTAPSSKAPASPSNTKSANTKKDDRADEPESVNANEENAKNVASDIDDYVNLDEPDARSDLEIVAGDAPGGDIFIKMINQLKPATMITSNIQSEVIYNKINPQMNDSFVGFDMSGYPSSIRFSTKCIRNGTLLFDGRNYHCIYKQDPHDYVVAGSKTAKKGRIHPKDKPNDLLFSIFIVLRSDLRVDEETKRSVILLPHQHGWSQSLLFYDVIGCQAVKSKTIQNVSGNERVFSTGSVKIDSEDEENGYETGLHFRPPKIAGTTASPSKKTSGTVKLTPAKRTEPRASSSTTKGPDNAKRITPVIRLGNGDLDVPSVRYDVNNWGTETHFDVSQGDLVLVGFEAKMMAFPFDQNPKYKYVTHTLHFMVHIGEYEKVDSDEESNN